jgi:hypothetical protein
MTRTDSLFSGSAVQGYLLLLLACGAALLLSIPAGTRVAHLMSPIWKPSPLLFHLTYLTLTSLLGTFRGIAATRWYRLQWGTASRLAIHGLFAQLMVLPYLVFARALLPGSGAVVLLLVPYATLTAFMFSLIGLRLDLWGRARRAHTFVLQYAIFGFIYLLPWVIGLLPRTPSIITVLSPVGAALRIAQAGTALELSVAFVFVLLMIFMQALSIRRRIRRAHVV